MSLKSSAIVSMSRPLAAAATCLIAGCSGDAGVNTSQSELGLVVSVSCHGVDDTAALQSAIHHAEQSAGSTVSIAAGTCALFDHLPLAGPHGIVVTGAGQTQTHLIQHARKNIFQITAPGNTVEQMHLNTAQYNTTYPPISKDPDPSVLFSSANDTHVIDITAEAGTGFGMRLTGPSPCSSYQVTGAVVQNVDMTNEGTGGFSSVDVDCQYSATVSGLVVHGGSFTPYQDRSLTLSGMTYTPGPYAQACEPAWEVTGPTVSIHISNVTSSGGWGREINSPSGVVVTSEKLTSGDSCKAGL